MKILYLECNMGAAGDMLSAALLELYEDKDEFLHVMNHIGLEGVRFVAEKSSKCGITGTHMSVRIHDEEEHSCDGHMHNGHVHAENSIVEHSHEGHHHASLEDIHNIIRRLSIPEQVKKDACAVYDRIADAESHAHDKPVTEIHFHEVGAMDAVADVVCSCYLIYLLDIKRIVASPVNVGFGQVHCAHGILPVPAPATAYLLQDIPTYSGKIEGEMCTPTGAALLAHFADDYGRQPVMKVHAVGYGMGKKDFPQANCVRAYIGECVEESLSEPNGEIAELSCNIDDMTGEQLGYAAERIREEGALDVFICPIQMKKNRSGQLLTCLCRKEEADRFARIILQETSTFGVRKGLSERYTLDRKFEKIETKYGTITVKEGEGYGIIKKKAEYEDIAEAAHRSRVSIREVQREVEKYL